MSNLNEKVAQFIELIRNGQAMIAFEKFYASDVEMIELDGRSFQGFDLNKKREEEFFSKISTVRKFEISGSIVLDNQAFIVYDIDLDHSDFGRMNLREIAIQTWKNGKIIREKFSA